jgi:integrase
VASKKVSDGAGSLFQRHEARWGCPPLDDEGERPKHTCRGPWVGVLTIGTHRKKVSGRTRAQASAALDELKTKREADTLPVGKPMSVEKWAKHWLTRIAPVEVADGVRRRRGVKDSSVETYATNVNQYIVPLLGTVRLDKLTADHIDEAWDYLLEEGNPLKAAEARTPLAPNTVHLAHTILRRLLKVAVQRKHLRTNPAGTDSMDAPPREEKEVVPIPATDVAKILKAAEGTPGAARWSVALALGLRPGEVRGLRWSDIDLKAGTLTVAQQMQRRTGRGLVAETPKSKSGNRIIPLPKTLLAAMKVHRKDQAALRLTAGDQWVDHDLVFCLDDGRPLDSKVDHRRWYALLEKAEVGRWRLYDARHSAATMLLLQGVPIRVVMEILGHSSIQVTMKYQHAVEEAMKDAAAKMETGIWGQGSN